MWRDAAGQGGRGGAAPRPSQRPVSDPTTEREAFHRADRRCRVAAVPAMSYARRADALAALGRTDLAARDRARVEASNRLDVAALRWLTRGGSDLAVRTAAAEALLGSDRAAATDVEAALALVFSSGKRLVVRAQRRGEAIAGWVAWQGDGVPSLAVGFGDGGRTAPRLILDARAGAAPRRARFAFRADPTLSAEVEATLPNGERRCAVAYPTSKSRGVLLPAPARPAALTVIVPVFGDPDSLAECLAALRPQCGGDVAVVMVDDASPDPRVSALAQSFCEGVSGHLVRARVNAGFAAAVNLGLERCVSGDVLVLNSDVILPPRALERLRAAARRGPDIGTVTPLSNDAGAASFPDPLGAGRALPRDERTRVDAAAEAANSGVSVDLPAALGSCLYVTRACLDRVGGLSLRYGRGYYEDTELYLRATEAGLRNVTACDTYVTHLGGRSFGPGKRALVTRNHDVLCRRFPRFERTEALFDAADPLRRVRGAIEERLGPDVGTGAVLVAPAFGCEALIDRTLRARAADGRPALVLRHAAGEGGVLVAVAASAAPWPLSLCFRLAADGDDGDRLAAYLGRIPRPELIVLRPERLPDPLRDALRGLDRTVGPDADGTPPRIAGDTERGGAAGPLEARPWGAHAGPGFPPRPRPAAAPARPKGREGARELRMLGVVVPLVEPAAEALVLAIARALRRRSRTHIIVLGRAVDEEQLRSSGNLWVTGPIAAGEIADVARCHGVDALLSPYRDGTSWPLDELREALGTPCAAFVAARGGMWADDLALDPLAPERDICLTVAAWCDPSPAMR